MGSPRLCSVSEFNSQSAAPEELRVADKEFSAVVAVGLKGWKRMETKAAEDVRQHGMDGAAERCLDGSA
jgi:hypothetical protein